MSLTPSPREGILCRLHFRTCRTDHSLRRIGAMPFKFPSLLRGLFGLSLLAALACLHAGAQPQPWANPFGVRWLAPAFLGGQLAAPPPVASAGIPTLRVSLSRSCYTIQPEGPTMPKDVLATATVLNLPPGQPPPSCFTWQVKLDWNSPLYPTHHSIGQKSFLHASPFAIDFGKEVRGGLLSVLATASLPDGRLLRGKAYAFILGENPSRHLVLSGFPRTRFGLIASKIGKAESGLRQFTSAQAGTPGGWPLVSRTGDMGVMQLNAPSGAVQSADEVWDWRANVRRGLLMLSGKRQTTVLASRHAVLPERTPEEFMVSVACLNCLRAIVGFSPLSPPQLRPLSAQAGTGLLPGEPDPDHLLLSQVEREGIRRYNGGSEYTFAVGINPDTLTFQNAGWQIDPTRGG